MTFITRGIQEQQHQRITKRFPSVRKQLQRKAISWILTQQGGSEDLLGLSILESKSLCRISPSWVSWQRPSSQSKGRGTRDRQQGRGHHPLPQVPPAPLSGCPAAPTALWPCEMSFLPQELQGLINCLPSHSKDFSSLPWHTEHNFYHSASAGILIKTSGALSLWLSCFSKIEGTLRGKQTVHDFLRAMQYICK